MSWVSPRNQFQMAVNLISNSALIYSSDGILLWNILQVCESYSNTWPYVLYASVAVSASLYSFDHSGIQFQGPAMSSKWTCILYVVWNKLTLKPLFSATWVQCWWICMRFRVLEIVSFSCRFSTCQWPSSFLHLSSWFTFSSICFTSSGFTPMWVNFIQSVNKISLGFFCHSEFLTLSCDILHPNQRT